MTAFDEESAGSDDLYAAELRRQRSNAITDCGLCGVPHMALEPPSQVWYGTHYPQNPAESHP